MTPPLTVFTPFDTNIAYIDETIASVLSQSFADFEYLLINDGDPENSRRIEHRFPDRRMRIVNTPSHAGLTALRNQGLRDGRGECIAFIDSDDVCEPDRFARQLDFLRRHPDHVLVGSALRYIDERSHTIGGRRYPENDADIRALLPVMNCIAQPSVIARRQALIDAGGYSEEFRYAEDYSLWLRAARLGKLHNLSEALIGYRIHAAATKRMWLKPALRDTTRLKIRAIREYGFPASPRVLISIAAHAALLLLPARVIFWLFRKMMITSSSAAP